MNGAPLSLLLLSRRATMGVTMTVLIVFSWFYLVRMADGMQAMPGMMEAGPLSTFLMWSVMMVGMMLPSPAPAILTFDAASRRRGAGAAAAGGGYAFGGGYLLAWTASSLAATLGQMTLQQFALLTPSMALASGGMAGAVLVAAGAFQWTSAKQACLRYCRSPLALTAGGWPVGHAAALRLGLRHGLFCIGCCWALMALMFVGGVMSLLWMAVLTIVVLLEKLLPGGRRFARVAGLGLAGLGVWMMVD